MRSRFTITAANSGQYASQLTAGQLAMFKAYPDYKPRAALED